MVMLNSLFPVATRNDVRDNPISRRKPREYQFCEPNILHWFDIPDIPQSSLDDLKNKLLEGTGIYVGNNEIQMDVPGFNKDNLSLTKEGRHVRIQGEENGRKIDTRVFVGNAEDIEAEVKDGVLTITFQKQEDKEQKEIPVK